MRIVLLLLDARTTNGLVSGIMNLSGPSWPRSRNSPDQRREHVGLVLDVAALLAIAGWGIVEMIVFWVLATFRREPA